MYVCMYVFGIRARVALTGLAIAEYFRDQEGQGAYHIHTYIHT
jgi:F0F1-type ATP synthase beta subunit